MARFDADGSAVFASLSRATGGDRRCAVEVLRETLVQVHRAQPHTEADPEADPLDLRHLLLASHRIYLADRRADDDFDDDDESARRASGDAHDWAFGRWSVALATLRGLTSRERVAINLHLVERIELAEVAASLKWPESEVSALIESGLRAVVVTGTRESAEEIFRRAEMWLGDDERDDVRVALGAPTRRTADDVDARSSAGSMRRWRPTKGAVLMAVTIVVAAIAGVRWVQTLPEERSPASASIDRIAAPVVTSGAFVGDVTNDDGTTVDVTPVRNALAGPEVTFLASGLTEQAVVVPQMIVRYSDGKVGLSWYGPCNRPAVAVAITNTTAGAAVELFTGEFPALSCIGMPTRWSAVVDPIVPVTAGTIRPVTDRAAVVPGFGYAEVDAPTGPTRTVREAAGYGSALVDDAAQPWVHGIGCSWDSTRYESPVGAIFEIRTETVDPVNYSTSDEIVCNNLASRPILAGPLGATFPHLNADRSDDPADCDGPVGSQTEVPGVRPFNTKFYDDDWSTWDGCLVRVDVIFSESLFETCAGADLRTITFGATIGERITRSRKIRTYIRDPGQVVDGTRPPFLTYVIAPSDLYDTGLRYHDQQLWLSPVTADAIYVRVGEKVERWPQLTDPVTCA